MLLQYYATCPCGCTSAGRAGGCRALVAPHHASACLATRRHGCAVRDLHGARDDGARGRSCAVAIATAVAGTGPARLHATLPAHAPRVAWSTKASSTRVPRACGNTWT